MPLTRPMLAIICPNKPKESTKGKFALTTRSGAMSPSSATITKTAMSLTVISLLVVLRYRNTWFRLARTYERFL